MDEFDVYLFSNTSSEIYTSNTLTRFTSLLPTPIYLGENHRYKVALTELILPPAYQSSLASKDCLVIHDWRLSRLHKQPTFHNFLDVILRVSGVDVSIYDREYFARYLDKSLCFNGLSLHTSALSVDAYPLNVVGEVIHFPLEIVNRIDPSVPAMSILPPVNFNVEHLKVFSLFLNNSFVPLFKSHAYKLSQILYQCIHAILDNTRLEGLSKDVNMSNIAVDSIIDSYKDHNGTIDFHQIQQALDNHIKQSNRMIHSFIDHFVEEVLSIRDDILKERKQQTEQAKSEFLVAYSDICAESFIGNIRARVLNLYKHKSGNFSFRDTNPKFVKVDKTIVRDISLILADENGIGIDLMPSSTPTFACLRFKKFFSE